MGSYSNIDPFVEEYVCEKLGLTPEPLSTQVIPRDRHAQFLAVLATVAATAEEIATEVRALQKSDTLEAEEPFAKGQKGSSAMPHKRNPITAERVCGLARVIKANAQVGFDNVALWHERDISHSSAERVVLADSTIALDYILGKLEWILDGLVLYPERMMANLESTRGLIYSTRVLLALVDTGMTREDAYAIVQANAMKVWDDIQQARKGPTFRQLLEADDDCTLTSEQLDEMLRPAGVPERGSACCSSGSRRWSSRGRADSGSYDRAPARKSGRAHNGARRPVVCRYPHTEGAHRWSQRLRGQA